jgi:hypothetical protein
MFISFLYIFRATMCPSSGEITVSMRHLVLVTLWMTFWYAGWNSTLHTRQSSTYSNKYEVSHRYSYFSWWWAHSCLKYVEKRNKHTKKYCAPSWLYLQNYTWMLGQQNIQFTYSVWKVILKLSIPCIFLWIMSLIQQNAYIHVYIYNKIPGKCDNIYFYCICAFCWCITDVVV